MAASFPQTLISLVSSFTLLLVLATTPVLTYETISFQYDFYQKPPISEGLRLEGDAHFTDETTYLRMTKTDESGKALKYSAGRAIYTTPIDFWEKGMKVDMETTMKFIINPNIGDTDVPADGFTFFIQPVGTEIGYNGASFGIFDEPGNMPSTFAIEFDIFLNPVDPTYRHIGIDFGSNVSNKTIDVGDAFIGQEVTARIDYEEATKMITVHVTAGSETYELSYEKDLTTFLTHEVQVGISASTGGQVAVHDLISWYFTATPVNTVYAEEGSGGIRQVV